MKEHVINSIQKQKKRQELLDEIDRILQTYCHGCLLYRHFKKEKGRQYAYRFCIHSCTVGEKLKECGKKLTEL
ncbi:zinc-finger domain-containing protein [Fervidibacillus halotolerans]|uniref:Zinc-finger domain-containing protein n=1 Tax=Fervidibacillus halotolerans TaxID=2980027 RepID=A0A9E8M152_9BACI|nr:zinc-finger domain-containing protein [Fervidibacillus halotolerans]WAA13266.1 zinc-finger domain-containing protein [Fervidibacillus halotolerans]